MSKVPGRPLPVAATRVALEITPSGTDCHLTRHTFQRWMRELLRAGFSKGAVISRIVLILGCFAPMLRAQMETATLSGRITDADGRVVAGVRVEATNVANGSVHVVETNYVGIYILYGLGPGRYRLTVYKTGFRRVIKSDLVLQVQDVVSQNFTLDVGSVLESISVFGPTPLVNAKSAAVSTVVNREFVDNLPVNGRSFQTLIGLTPGTVFTPSDNNDPGQFSSNGQRASSNYFTVDGVSANVGVAPAFGAQQAAGTIPGFTALGGTNSLVSVDAMQEFRVQTSTFAPELGRAPGAQTIVVTKSGTNQFHGKAFDYFRNDVFDANDWFANRNGLPRAEERQQDFGGIFGGPILRNRTFFFFSYEGLLLRLPQSRLTTVPSLASRRNAQSLIRPFLNAFPLPNGPDAGSDISRFSATFSNKSRVDSTSLRIDHAINDKLRLFGRYGDAPSDIGTRGAGAQFNVFSLSTVERARIHLRTMTVGAAALLSSDLANDFRLNYSINRGSLDFESDDFGGAIPPPDTVLFPKGFTSRNATFDLSIGGLLGRTWATGRVAANRQRQWNLVDNVSLQRGTHSLRAGVDFRRLTPSYRPGSYGQLVTFHDVASLEAGLTDQVALNNSLGDALLLNNLSAFAQDSWRMRPSLTVTYGLRWDVDFAPSTTSGPPLPALNSADPATLRLAPVGTPVFRTVFTNFAPRLGISYQLSDLQNYETVVRGGVGLFYDLSTQQIADEQFVVDFPFGASSFTFFKSFPLSAADAQPPPITSDSLVDGTVAAPDPHLALPRVLEWNVAVQQGIDRSQSLTMTYSGARGRRLLQSSSYIGFNPAIGQLLLSKSSSSSDYQALQAQFDRKLASGLQTLFSYTWSHSIDTGSTSSLESLLATPTDLNRGSSDFDVRHSFSAALNYSFSSAVEMPVIRKAVRGWSLASILLARSATPVDVVDGNLQLPPSFIEPRPDRVPGVPLYLYDSSLPGGRGINPAAFADPPNDPATRLAFRQGTLGRNALRGFGALQWDLALHRHFALGRRFDLQFRAEFFNVLNHPSFGNPVPNLGAFSFGQSTQMLGKSLGGATGNGGFNPIYQIGGPRSGQFALSLSF